MSRNFFNILEGFQNVEESLNGPEGQYVEEIDFANMSRNTSQYVEEKFVDILEVSILSKNFNWTDSMYKDNFNLDHIWLFCKN